MWTIDMWVLCPGVMFVECTVAVQPSIRHPVSTAVRCSTSHPLLYSLYTHWPQIEVWPRRGCVRFCPICSQFVLILPVASSGYVISCHVSVAWGTIRPQHLVPHPVLRTQPNSICYCECFIRFGCGMKVSCSN